MTMNKSRKCSPFATRGGRFEVRAAAKDAADVFLYDEIGYFGVTADQFVSSLKGITAKTINLHINSPGGDVFDGAAIYNALKSHGAKIITHVDGIAASYASIIALAGSEVRMAKNAFMMIHNAWSISIGTAADMRKEADMLDKICAVMAKNYADKTGKPMDTMQKYMDDETWFTAQEAKDLGLVDTVEDGAEEPSALFDLSVFSNAPENYRNLSREMPDKRQLEDILRTAGCSQKQALTILSKGYEAASPSDSGAGNAEIASQIAAAIEATSIKIKLLTQ